MNLLPTADQRQILEAARAFLGGEAPLSRLRPEHGEIGNTDHELWPRLGELGFWALSISEDAGGAGLSVCEEHLIYREFGRHLLSLGALGLTLGARVAAADPGSEAFGAISTGAARVAVGNPLGDGAKGEALWHLLEGRNADWVVTWSEAGGMLYRADQFRVSEDLVAMDSHMTLLRAELADSEPAAFLPAEKDDLRLRALTLIAAYAVGIAEATRDQAVEYAKVREQFGQPIGRFQAVKHRCAEMAMRTEVALCQAIYAALAFDSHLEDEGLQVIAAKVLATDAALRNSADSIQVHGAFGFTAEADCHLFLKRAHTLDFLGGAQREQKAALLRQPGRADYGVW